jgi:hypothetical protein
VFQSRNYPIKEHRKRRSLVHVNDQPRTIHASAASLIRMVYSHTLKVMLLLEVDKITEKYFIDRWHKKRRKLFNHVVPPPNEDNTILRFNALSRMLGHTTSHASKNKRKYCCQS